MIFSGGVLSLFLLVPKSQLYFDELSKNRNGMNCFSVSIVAQRCRLLPSYLFECSFCLAQLFIDTLVLSFDLITRRRFAFFSFSTRPDRVRGVGRQQGVPETCFRSNRTKNNMIQRSSLTSGPYPWPLVYRYFFLTKPELPLIIRCLQRLQPPE
jgi:hypothetical protein